MIQPLADWPFIKADYPSAIRYYESYLKAVEKTGKVDSLFLSYTGLARAYEGMDNYPRLKNIIKRR